MLKIDLLQNHQLYCLEAHVCSFHPGHFIDWGSEGVKMVLIAANLNAGVIPVVTA